MLAKLARLRVDTTPLRTSRDFRAMWLAGLIFYTGAMVSYVAIPYQVYALTQSNFMVGLIGLVELAPIIVFGLYGGAAADHFDRRRVLIVTGAIQVVLTAILAWNAFQPEPSLTVIFVVAALLTSAGSMQRPSREALTPRTVSHAEIPAASALSTLAMTMGRLVGPAVAGVLLALVGIGWCFLLDVIGLALATGLYATLNTYALIGDSEPPSLRGIGEGLRYALSRRDLLGTYVVDLVAMFLAMPVVLFPAISAELYGNPELIGALYTAETAGALVATAASGWTLRVYRHGRAIVLAAATFGACIAIAGLMSNFWLLVAFLALAGAADTISAIFRGTIWNQTIPDHMRGRLAGIEMLSYSLGPMASQARAGLVADRWSVRGSVVSGGVACVVGVAASALWLRDFWAYDARSDVYAQAERAARNAG